MADRSQLLSLKLAALVREHTGSAQGTPVVWPGGAALARDGSAWILSEDDPQRALGPALAWSHRHGLGMLNVLAERATGVLARRAAYFTVPPAVWHVEGRVLLEAVPEPFLVADPVEPDLQELRELIAAGGAEPLEEHGVLIGEVEGLEVCRAVRDPSSGACRLEVGIGVHDREAFQLIHGDVPPITALAGVVNAVAPHRHLGAEPHPLNRIAADRALRARLLREPSLVGAASLRVADPPVVRRGVKDNVACVAIGQSGEKTVVVVCSTGVDLDVVPFAADARATLGGRADRLVIAVPARDAAPITRELAALLRQPAEVVGL